MTSTVDQGKLEMNVAGELRQGTDSMVGSNGSPSATDPSEASSSMPVNLAATGGSGLSMPTVDESVASSASASASTRIPLTRLTCEQCINLLYAVGCKGVERTFGTKNLTGEDLYYVETIDELREFKMPLINIQLKKLFNKLIEWKEEGVPEDLLNVLYVKEVIATDEPDSESVDEDQVPSSTDDAVPLTSTTISVSSTKITDGKIDIQRVPSTEDSFEIISAPTNTTELVDYPADHFVEMDQSIDMSFEQKEPPAATTHTLELSFTADEKPTTTTGIALSADVSASGAPAIKKPRQKKKSHKELDSESFFRKPTTPSLDYNVEPDLAEPKGAVVTAIPNMNIGNTSKSEKLDKNSFSTGYGTRKRQSTEIIELLEDEEEAYRPTPSKSNNRVSSYLDDNDEGEEIQMAKRLSSSQSKVNLSTSKVTEVNKKRKQRGVSPDSLLENSDDEKSHGGRRKSRRASVKGASFVEYYEKENIRFSSASDTDMDSRNESDVERTKRRSSRRSSASSDKIRRSSRASASSSSGKYREMDLDEEEDEQNTFAQRRSSRGDRIQVRELPDEDDDEDKYPIRNKERTSIDSNNNPAISYSTKQNTFSSNVRIASIELNSPAQVMNVLHIISEMSSTSQILSHIHAILHRFQSKENNNRLQQELASNTNTYKSILSLLTQFHVNYQKEKDEEIVEILSELVHILSHLLSHTLSSSINMQKFTSFSSSLSSNVAHFATHQGFQILANILSTVLSSQIASSTASLLCQHSWSVFIFLFLKPSYRKQVPSGVFMTLLTHTLQRYEADLDVLFPCLYTVHNLLYTYTTNPTTTVEYKALFHQKQQQSLLVSLLNTTLYLAYAKKSDSVHYPYILALMGQTINHRCNYQMDDPSCDAFKLELGQGHKVANSKRSENVSFFHLLRPGLSQYYRNQDELTLSLFQVLSHVLFVEENGHLFIESKIAIEVIQAMKWYSTSHKGGNHSGKAGLETVVLEGCRVIVNVSTSAKGQSHIGEVEGCIDLIVTLLRQHLFEDHVVDEVCRVITNLALCESNQRSLYKHGVCEVLMKALRTYCSTTNTVEKEEKGSRKVKNEPERSSGLATHIVQNKAVIEQICRSFANMTLDQESKEKFAQMKLIPMFLSILQECKFTSGMMGIVRRILLSCTNLMSVADNVMCLLDKLSCTAMLVKLGSAYVKQLDMIIEWCALLASIGYAYTPAQKTRYYLFFSQLHSDAILDVYMKVLKDYMEEDYLVKDMVAFMSTFFNVLLSDDEDDGSVITNLSDMSLIQAVNSIGKVGPRREADDERYLTEGHISTCLNVLQLHLLDPDLVRDMLNILIKVGNNDPNFYALVYQREGVCELVMEIITTYQAASVNKPPSKSSSGGKQESKKTSEVEEEEEEEREEGEGEEKEEEGDDEDIDIEDILDMVSDFVKFLSSHNQSCAATFSSFNLPELFLNYLQKFMEDTALLPMLVQTIVVLIHEDIEYKRKLVVQVDCIDILVQGLRFHVKEPNILLPILILLNSLVEVSMVVQLLSPLDVCKTLMHVVETHGGHVKVVYYSYRLILEMMKQDDTSSVTQWNSLHLIDLVAEHVLKHIKLEDESVIEIMISLTEFMYKKLGSSVMGWDKLLTGIEEKSNNTYKAFGIRCEVLFRRLQELQGNHGNNF